MGYIIRCLKDRNRKKIENKNRNRDVGSFVTVEGVYLWNLSGPCFVTLVFSIFVNDLEREGILR